MRAFSDLIYFKACTGTEENLDFTSLYSFFKSTEGLSKMKKSLAFTAKASYLTIPLRLIIAGSIVPEVKIS